MKFSAAAGFVAAATETSNAQKIHLSDESRKEFEELLSVQPGMDRQLLAVTDFAGDPEGPLDRVYYWNNVALNLSATDHTPPAQLPEGSDPSQKPDPRRFGEQLGPHRASYAMAIIQIAVFEAANAFSKKYKGYTGYSATATPEAGASIDAAITQAAYDAMRHLYPFKKDDPKGLFDRDIARISNTVDVKATQAGQKVGQAAAKSIIEMRDGDGSDHTEINFKDLPVDDGPRKWSIDPVSKIETALGAKWPTVKPFVLSKADQFRLSDPPNLTDEKYIKAFNEVKDIGRKGEYPADTSRRKGETFRAIFWGYDGTPNLCAPPRLYNQLIRTITNDKKISDALELSRVFALCNTVMADAAIAAWDSKYHHRFWRPVTGIQWTGMGGDTSNVPDPTWEPLGSPNTDSIKSNFTPPFPAYPSGHATFGGALFTALRLIFPDTGDDTPFVLVSDEFNGKHKGIHDKANRPYLPLSFVALEDAEFENAFSRVWLGVHWRYDGEDGIALGRNVGKFVVENSFGT
ncbi:vanadium-dependent haloperoxidase [Mesorhizobium sp. WSM3224]|uniref:vanadium-dependent haloperoxidase n=1 Tax=Mesorhizobium sp. WSM3224 TaxID=1040986 RepID=UPI0018DD79A6|nr:vanadium-dependent haloperoxidase [Mesorhizobium sp. WSM3224]